MKNLTLVSLGTVVVALLLGVYAYAAVGDRLPNLVALPASNIRIVESNGATLLRFSTTSWNNGAGALELRADVGDRVTGQNVYQKIYTDTGSREVLAGTFEWHELHNHFHFEDYALYTLQPIDAPGASLTTGSKTTFCIMDTTRVNTKLSGAPKQAVYSTCGKVVQGMSVGWGDTYGYQLPGQEFDITALPNGDYRLKIELDPRGRIIEFEETADNSSSVDIRISNGTVSVIGAKPGRRN